MKRDLFLLIMLSVCCQIVVAQSQTKTAYVFNWNGNPYLNLWAREGAQYVSADDNSYAYSKRLTAGRNFLSLTLQDFRFTIPANATITSINVVVRRFKKGTGSIKDYFANLVVAGSGYYNPSEYGVRWTKAANYPDAEGVVQYYQTGVGSNGGAYGNQSYQWTPTKINNPAFGVRIDANPPVGGSVVVYYDQVKIKVQYSLPLARSTSQIETNTLKEPSVYPNPFRTTTKIRFTAAETGNSVVELYDILGAKIQTLFSGSVVQGQEMTVVAGITPLSKGVYIYEIRNSRQKYTGKILKLE